MAYNVSNFQRIFLKYSITKVSVAKKDFTLIEYSYDASKETLLV